MFFKQTPQEAGLLYMGNPVLPPIIGYAILIEASWLP